MLIGESRSIIFFENEVIFLDKYLENEKWIIRSSNRKFIVGISDNNVFNDQCNFLLRKNSFKSLSEHALSVEIPVEDFKIISFEKNIDSLLAMAILKMRKDGLPISENARGRIRNLSSPNHQESVLATTSYILKPGIDFNTRLQRAVLWLQVGVMSDGGLTNRHLKSESGDCSRARSIVGNFREQSEGFSYLYETLPGISAR